MILLVITDLLTDTFLLTIVLTSVLAGFTIALTILYYFDSRVFDVYGKQLPGPSHHFWGKNYFALLRQSQSGSKHFSQLISDIFLPEVGDGNLVAVNLLGGSNMVYIAHPDMVKTVLLGHFLKFKKDSKWNRMFNILGDGLLTCDDRQWQMFRDFLNPLSKSQVLRGMVTVFNIHARRLLRHWHFRTKKAELEHPPGSNDNKNGKSQIVNEVSIKVLLDDDIRNLITGIICETGFGYDFFTKLKSEAIVEDFETIIEEVQARLLDPVPWYSFFFPERRKKAEKAIKSLQNLIDSIIEERLAENDELDSIDTTGLQAFDENSLTTHSFDTSSYSSSKSTDKATAMLSISTSTYSSFTFQSETNSPTLQREAGQDFLQLLLILNEERNELQKMSKRQIRDHLLTFMVFGFENTVYTLMWLLYELAKNPEVQKKCQDEIDSIMNVNGIKTSAVVFEDIPKFSQLIQSIKETMRLHPTIPFIKRECTTECNLGEYCLRPNSTIFIAVNALHRNPEYWYLPHEFCPDRFSQLNIIETMKHPFQYVPFGAGTRNCIGQRFAQMALTVVSAVLLSKFNLRISESDQQDIHFVESYMNFPSNLRLTVSAREN